MKLPAIDLSRRNHQIIVAVSIAIVLIGALITIVLLVTRSNTPESPSDHPALKVGQTSLSKTQYKNLIDAAAKSQVSADEAKERIITKSHLQEVARLLSITVPDALIKQYAGSYTVGTADAVTDYDLTVAYPKAFYTVVALMEQGGSVVTLYHAPFAQGDQDSQQYAKDDTDNVKTMTGVTGKRVYNDDKEVTTDKIHGYLTIFGGDGKINGHPDANLTGVKGVTTDGQIVTALDSDAIEQSAVAHPGNATYVQTASIDASVLAQITGTKEKEWSTPTKLASQSAYLVLYKDKAYAKDQTIQSRVTAALQTVKEEVAS